MRSVSHSNIISGGFHLTTRGEVHVRNYRNGVTAAIVAIAVAFGGGCSTKDAKNETAATVNGEDVKIVELREFLGFRGGVVPLAGGAAGAQEEGRGKKDAQRGQQPVRVRRGDEGGAGGRRTGGPQGGGRSGGGGEEGLPRNDGHGSDPADREGREGGGRRRTRHGRRREDHLRGGPQGPRVGGSRTARRGGFGEEPGGDPTGGRPGGDGAGAVLLCEEAGAGRNRVDEVGPGRGGAGGPHQ